MELKGSREYESVKGIKDIPMKINEGSKHLIMSMLRSQIYSNPIETFIRELISNAVDAHIRAGKKDVPFDLSLPTAISPFVIRDYGNSMTTEVIEHVYAEMGASDKRDSNEELGAFGIGAASPLAYTNLFYIETFTQEGKVVVYRKWAQYLDSTLMGKLTLLTQEEDVEQPTGTQITVPIAEKDSLDPFHSAIVKYTTYLKVRPNIQNAHLEYNDAFPPYYGENWRWDEEGIQLMPSNSSLTTITPTAVIGGVPYPITPSQFKEGTSSLPIETIEVFFKQKIVLFFDVGSIDISANREQLQYTPKTIRQLLTRLEELLEDMKIIVSSTVYTAPNYLQACVRWYELPSGVRLALFASGYRWNSKPFAPAFKLRSDNCTIKLYQYDTKSNYNPTIVIRSSKQALISAEVYEQAVVAVYVNDTGTKAVNSQLIQYLIDTCKITRLYIIQPEELSSLDETHGLTNSLHPEDISELGVESIEELKKQIGRDEKERKERVFGYVDGYYLLRRGDYRIRATGATAWFEPNKYKVNQGGVYVVFEDNWQIMSDPNSTDLHAVISEDTLRKVIKLLGIQEENLYGFKRSVLHRLKGEWTLLTDIIEQRLNGLSNTIDLQHVINISHERHKALLAHQVYTPFIPVLQKSIVLDCIQPDSPFKVYNVLSDSAQAILQSSLTQDLLPLLYMSTQYLHYEPTSVTEYWEEVKTRYSLITALSNRVVVTRPGNEEELLAKGFVEYINLIDDSLRSKLTPTPASELTDSPICKINLPKTWIALMETLCT